MCLGFKQYKYMWLCFFSTSRKKLVCSLKSRAESEQFRSAFLIFIVFTAIKSIGGNQSCRLYICRSYACNECAVVGDHGEERRSERQAKFVHNHNLYIACLYIITHINKRLIITDVKIIRCHIVGRERVCLNPRCKFNFRFFARDKRTENERQFPLASLFHEKSWMKTKTRWNIRGSARSYHINSGDEISLSVNERRCIDTTRRRDAEGKWYWFKGCKFYELKKRASLHEGQKKRVFIRVISVRYDRLGILLVSTQRSCPRHIQISCTNDNDGLRLTLKHGKEKQSCLCVCVCAHVYEYL